MWLFLISVQVFSASWIAHQGTRIRQAREKDSCWEEQEGVLALTIQRGEEQGRKGWRECRKESGGGIQGQTGGETPPGERESRTRGRGWTSAHWGRKVPWETLYNPRLQEAKLFWSLSGLQPGSRSRICSHFHGTLIVLNNKAHHIVVHCSVILTS